MKEEAGPGDLTVSGSPKVAMKSGQCFPLSPDCGWGSGLQLLMPGQVPQQPGLTLWVEVGSHVLRAELSVTLVEKQVDLALSDTPEKGSTFSGPLCSLSFTRSLGLGASA